MPFTPTAILGIWLRNLLAVVLVVGGVYLLYRFYEDSHVVERTTAVVAADRVPGAEPVPVSVTERRVFRFDPGWNRPTLELVAGLTLLLWATLGRPIGQGLRSLTMRSETPTSTGHDQGTGSSFASPADLTPAEHRTGEVHTITRPNGTVLRVECYGPADAPPIVWSHGWGANSTEWFYVKRSLTDRFRLIVWDEPGLGLSKKPDDNDYRLETMAADLDAVLALAGGRPAVLVGHSIGGMIALTYCREYPEALGSRVAGLVLAHTTYTNPIRTAFLAKFFTAIEKPVIIPLLHLMIALWPVVWVMNWMSYINGSAHRMTRFTGFSGNETRGQLNFVTSFMPHARPDVVARGMFGMMDYDVTATLPEIHVPTLVIVGDQDMATSPEAGAYIAQQIPQSQLITLAPAKHMGLVEHHERFDNLVADFAKKCQPEEATVDG